MASRHCPNHWLGDFPAFKWRQLAPHLPATCGDGIALTSAATPAFTASNLQRSGAEVLGIDVDDTLSPPGPLGGGAVRISDRVRFEQMQVYDLARRAEEFDLVLFMGVLYHLRYPDAGAGHRLPESRRLMVFQTMTMPDDEVRDQPIDCPFEDRHLWLNPAGRKWRSWNISSLAIPPTGGRRIILRRGDAPFGGHAASAGSPGHEIVPL